MESELAERLNPILKVMKLREENYFRLVDFIDKNMQGMSNEAEQLTIVTIFLQQLNNKEEAVLQQQHTLLASFANLTSPSKLVSRLCARIFELLQQSLLKIRNTYFHTARVESDFTRFKVAVNDMLVSSDRVALTPLATTLFHYSRSKFLTQQNKLQRFATKLEAGYHVYLKDLYDKAQGEEDEDDEGSKKYPDRKKDQNVAKESKPKAKKNTETSKKLRSSDNKSESTKLKSSEKSESRPSGNMVTKMMRLYSVVDPSKTQFIEDMVYANIDDQKAKFVAALLDKNKANFQQMKEFREKAEAEHVDLEELQIHAPQPFSDPDDHAQPGTPPGYKSVSFFKGVFVIKSHKLNNFMRKKEDEERIFGSDYSSGAEYMSDNGGAGTGAVWVGQRHDKTPGKRHRTLVKSNKDSSSRSNSLASRTPSMGLGTGNKKVFPNLSRAYKLNQYCDEPVIGNQSAIATSRNNNRVFIVKSPTVVDEQQIRNKLVVGGVAATSRREEKQSPTPIYIQATSQLNTRRSPGRQGSVMQQQSTLEMERSRLLGEKPRREYNLRMKKQMKKSIVSTQFMQANEHLSNYNFPEDR